MITATRASRRVAIPLAVAVLALSGCGDGRGSATSTSTSTSSAPRPSTHSTATAPSAAASTRPSTSAPTVVAPATATQRIERLRTGQTRVSVAAVNTVTGATYSFGATSGMWTASVYKLLVLETLVLQRQRAGDTLSDAEADAATTMIENSDDDAAYQLFLDLGGRAGLTTGIHRLGLTHTVAGRSDPTFTTTSATACLRLLRNLVKTGGPLNARSRAYILHLMRSVERDQRWGVGIVADAGTAFANKNGWVSVDDTNGPGEQDDGRWITNSVGIVTVHGQQVLMSVLTEHNPDFRTGVRLVQAIAKATVPTVVAGA